MKISYVKVIFIGEPSISYVKYIFQTPRFPLLKFEPIHFSCELSISYLRMSPFHMWNKNFTCEMTCEIFVRDVKHVIRT